MCVDYYHFTLYFIDYRCITHSKNHDPHVKYATAEDTAPSNLIEQSTTADALVKGFIKTRIKSPRASEKIKMSSYLHGYLHDLHMGNDILMVHDQDECLRVIFPEVMLRKFRTFIVKSRPVEETALSARGMVNDFMEEVKISKSRKSLYDTARVKLHRYLQKLHDTNNIMLDGDEVYFI